MSNICTVPHWRGHESPSVSLLPQSSNESLCSLKEVIYTGFAIEAIVEIGCSIAMFRDPSNIYTYYGIAVVTGVLGVFGAAAGVAVDYFQKKNGGVRSPKHEDLPLVHEVIVSEHEDLPPPKQEALSPSEQKIENLRKIVNAWEPVESLDHQATLSRLIQFTPLTHELLAKANDSNYFPAAFFKHFFYGFIWQRLNPKALKACKVDWIKVDYKIKKYAERGQEFQGNSKVIWVTGTRSSSLIGIDRVAMRVGCPALVPTGELLKWNIVPLAGELGIGICKGKVNVKSLSGNYLENCPYAYSYSQRKNELCSKNELENAFFYYADKIYNADNIGFYLLPLKLNVLQLIQNGADIEVLNRARTHIETKLLSENTREDIQPIIDLFDTEGKLELNDEEQQILNDPYPIIWGMTNKEITGNLYGVDSDCKEASYEGILRLGSDITVAFTKKKRVEQLRKWLVAHKLSTISVMTFGTMGYLAAMKALKQR